jgi:ethanolamine ammonia-lyase small subunit
MAYNATPGMPEANRTVLSNIHQGGIPAVEAGAHIADVVKKMLDQKASGLDLKK